MATIGELILDVEDMIYGLPQIERPVEDTLATAVTADSDTSWQFTGFNLWKRGDYAEFLAAAGAVGEVVYVAEDQASAVDKAVRRAQVRTTAAASYSIGDVFRKNPLFPRVKIDRYIDEIVDGLFPDVWIRTSRSLDVNTSRYYYPLNAADFEVEQVYQADTDVTALGDVTYDETGGAAEDLWTAGSAHGLAVGDKVRFTAAGTGATGYTTGTVYWVAAVPATTTFTLSATEGGSAIAGTDDSAGTWTAEQVNSIRFEPLPPDAWQVVAGVDGRTSSTGRILRISGWYDDTASLYYTAKTKPSSSSYSDIPAAMADFIPYGVVWLLLGGTRVIPGRTDPLRTFPEGFSPAQPMADSRFFRDEFERRKAEYRRQLDADLYPRNYLRRNAVVRR